MWAGGVRREGGSGEWKILCLEAFLSAFTQFVTLYKVHFGASKIAECGETEHDNTLSGMKQYSRQLRNSLLGDEVTRHAFGCKTWQCKKTLSKVTEGRVCQTLEQKSTGTGRLMAKGTSHLRVLLLALLHDAWQQHCIRVYPSASLSREGSCTQPTTQFQLSCNDAFTISQEVSLQPFLPHPSRNPALMLLLRKWLPLNDLFQKTREMNENQYLKENRRGIQKGKYSTHTSQPQTLKILVVLPNVTLHTLTWFST